LFQSSDRAHVVTPIKLDSYEISPPEIFPKSQAKKCSITRILQLYYSQRTMQRPNRTTLDKNIKILIPFIEKMHSEIMSDPNKLGNDSKGPYRWLHTVREKYVSCLVNTNEPILALSSISFKGWLDGNNWGNPMPLSEPSVVISHFVPIADRAVLTVIQQTGLERVEKMKMALTQLSDWLQTNYAITDVTNCLENPSNQILHHIYKPLSVIFAHGKESGPWGEKILALANVARSHGHAVESPDFRGMDDPEERVKHLLKIASGMRGPYILVGSSMGGYVSLRASRKLLTLGLFLMAPAVGLAGYRVPRPVPGCKLVTIVHAWQDEIIPVHNLIDYAERHQTELHLVNSDHRLSGQIAMLTQLFDKFLGQGIIN
jgi:hypothetical protein